MLQGKLTYSGLGVITAAAILRALGLGGEQEAAQLVLLGTEMAGVLMALRGRWRIRRKG